MEVGVLFNAHEGVTWTLWETLAGEVEELGYESLWCPDHLVSVEGEPCRERLDTWTAITFLATITRKVRLGTLVSPITWNHPSLLAMKAAALDVLSGGRIEVGIGAGWNDYEHVSFGIPMPPISTRFDMLEEATQVMRLLWSGEVAYFSGRHYRLDGAHAHPLPIQQPHPPLVIGGIGEKRTLPVIAKYADEWNGGLLPLDAYKAKRAVLDRLCDAVGRSPLDVASSLLLPLVIGEDLSEVESRISRLRGGIVLNELYFPRQSSASPAALRALGWAAGTPGEVQEHLQKLRAAGVSRVVLQILDLEDRESLRVFSRDVLPSLS